MSIIDPSNNPSTFASPLALTTAIHLPRWPTSSQLPITLVILILRLHQVLYQAFSIYLMVPQHPGNTAARVNFSKLWLFCFAFPHTSQRTLSPPTFLFIPSPPPRRTSEKVSTQFFLTRLVLTTHSPTQNKYLAVALAVYYFSLLRKCPPNCYKWKASDGIKELWALSSLASVSVAG